MVLPMILKISAIKYSQGNPRGKAEVMKMYKNKQGLTLIEILAAMIIVAVLASITIKVVSHIDNQSNEQGIESTFALLDSALQEYYEYWKGFPDPDMTPYLTHSAALYGQLKDTPKTSTLLEGISEKLIKNNPDQADMPEIYDPWGTILDYRYVPGDSFPRLVSAGPDKVFNTADDIQNR